MVPDATSPPVTHGEAYAPPLRVHVCSVHSRVPCGLPSCASLLHVRVFSVKVSSLSPCCLRSSLSSDLLVSSQCSFRLVSSPCSSPLFSACSSVSSCSYLLLFSPSPSLLASAFCYLSSSSASILCVILTSSQCLCRLVSSRRFVLRFRFFFLVLSLFIFFFLLCSSHLCYSEFSSSLFFSSLLFAVIVFACHLLFLRVRLFSSVCYCSFLLVSMVFSPSLPVALFVIFSSSSFSSCSPPTFHRSGPLNLLTTDETRTLFLRISGSRFLSPSQHLRWCAAPNARCCGGQGLPPSASGRLDGPVLTGTRRRANTCWNPSCSQPRWNSTGGPVIFGKPLRRRNAVATSG